jgi:class 3 adenylate cyclase/tetratricopeptide (TPR) repeat protein
VIVCPACGEGNPERARFCIACGTQLPGAPQREEERKLVTVVFAELLGIHKATREFDPEDLKRVLEPFHARVGRLVANHGGTVDKFVGATALCVFGAPVAHEDDPERGVRAALRIREGVVELDDAEPRLDLSVRIGVNTGEAVIARPGVGPQIGEAVTGDVVNTASRLQTAAEPGEILVGASTYEATGLVFEWDEHEPVLAKGKAEPQTAWLAVASRGRQGVDLRPPSASPFIGRRDELALLQSAFRRAIGESTVQLVTVTGDAGVGKSRLIHQLADFAEEWPSLVRWRQGRSLPYGEGLSFWALGEIVKSDADILESDSPEDAATKLAESLEPYLPDAIERDRLRAALAPLAGIEGASFEAPREELFGWWRRWFEALASDSAFVVVFEDLQWADDVMLGFVEYLVDWAVGLPLLVVCAARPELYERHPLWGGGRRNSTSIALPPLSHPETSMLLGALLEGVVLPASAQLELLERCGGNPLYAEEFVRMLRDRGVVIKGVAPGAGEGLGVPMPRSVQQLIGARLDTLPPTEKSVLQDAAVVGKVFWAGAIEAMSGLPEDVVVRSLHESVRREFVRPVRASSFAGQEEFAFNHMLVREVAYGQIPRAGRAVRHVEVARWLRAAGADRVFEVAELLAHHYAEALGFARATDPTRNTAGLAAAAGAALMMAADRAKRMDAGRAVELYRRARAYLPSDDPERRRALLESAEAAEEAGLIGEAEADFDAAIAEYRASGDRLGLGEALARRARSTQEYRGGARALLEEAIGLLETEPAGPELVRACTRMAGHLYVAGSNAAAIEWADRALALADDVGLENETVLALQYRGAARSQSGDEGGLEDLREALRRGLELGLGDEVATTYNNLAYELWFWVGPEASLAVWEELAAFCRVRGFATGETWAESGKLESLFDLGRWDEVFASASELREWGRAHGFRRVNMISSIYRGWVLLRRGDADAAGREVEELLPQAREIGYGEFLAPALMIAAEVALATGDRPRCRELVGEFEDRAKANPEYWRVFLPVAARLLVSLGEVDDARSLLAATGDAGSRRQRLSVLSSRAVVEEVVGAIAAAADRYREAADGWATYGFGLEEASTRTGLARCLLALDREAEARSELGRARALLEPLGARPMLDEIEDLLTRAGATA